MISLTLDIAPVPKGRARMTRQGHAYTPAKTREFESRLAWLVMQQYKGQPLKGALKVTVTFYFPEPKRRVRPHPSVKPDLDNAIKAVGDALNGVLWDDDSQICLIDATKQYAPRGRILISVEEIK